MEDQTDTEGYVDGTTRVFEYVPTSYFPRTEPGEVLKPGETWRDTKGTYWFVEEVVFYGPGEDGIFYQLRVRKLASPSGCLFGRGSAKRVWGNPPPRGWTLAKSQVPARPVEPAPR